MLNVMKHTTLTAVLGTVLLASCGGEKDSPGLEYMPDMYRSPAIEAYVDYGQDPYYFDDETVIAERNTQSARLAPAGTIPWSALWTSEISRHPPRRGVTSSRHPRPSWAARWPPA